MVASVTPDPSEADLSLQLAVEWPSVISRNCPNCNRPQPADAFIRAAAAVENALYNSIGKAWQGPEGRTLFSYSRCSACGLVFAPTYLIQEAMRHCYLAVGHKIDKGNEQLASLTGREYCSVASRYLPEARRYCEIAPDQGQFLHGARQHYSLTEAILVEPNAALWPRFKGAATGLKATIITSPEEYSGSAAADSIDLLVAIHTLERLLVPADMLRWVNRVLSPKGIAVFVVYNERSLLARLMGRRWFPYRLQPPQLYSSATLKASLEKQGLLVKAIRPVATHISAALLITQAAFALTNRQYSFGWLSWPVRLKLGDIMAIASRA